MSNIKCRVLDHVDRFYLPDSPKQYVKSGSVVELNSIEAKMQIEAKMVVPLSDAEAKILQAETVGVNAIVAEKDLQLQQMAREIALLKKKKTDDEELTLLKAQIAELTKQNEALQNVSKKK